MIDTATGQVYYTPVFHVLSQLSRSVRPGDRAVEVTTMIDKLGADDIHASASLNDDNLLSVQILNTTKKPIEYQLQIGSQYAVVTIDANALQTVAVQM
jgi:glucosylceramidase